MAKRPKQPPESGRKVGPSVNCSNYPPGKTPKLTTAELQAISEKAEQGQLPTKQEVHDVQAEGRRALEKVEVMTVSIRQDAGERVLSAAATVRATFSLHGLAEAGRDYRAQQRKKASAQKTPHLDAAILAELRKDHDAKTLDIWNALSNYHQGDLRIKVVEGVMEWDYVGTPESSRSLKFNSFESKVSRLRRQLRPK